MSSKHLALKAFLGSVLLAASIATAGAQSAVIQALSQGSGGFAEAQHALGGHSVGIFADDSPNAQIAIRQEWRTIEDWTAQILNRSPNTTTDDLAAGITELYGDLKVQAIQIDTDTYLVAASDGQIGTAFIVGLAPLVVKPPPKPVAAKAAPAKPKAKPVKTKPGSHHPAKATPAKAAPSDTVPSDTDASKAEPAKAEPAKPALPKPPAPKHFAVLWRISDGVGKSAKDFPMVAAWTADRARLNCRQANKGAAAAICGPVAATAIDRLPDQKDGTKRFYIDATYAQLDSPTVDGQLTIWQWKAGKPTPAFGGIYSYNPDHDPHLGMVDGALHIHTRAQYQSFADCGSCAGRLMDWTILVTPDKVADGGKTSLAPELDLADTLFKRLLDRKPVADIADAGVVPVLAPMIASARQEASTSRQPLSLGALEESKITAEDAGHTLCMTTDAGGPYAFLIDTSTAKWRVTAAEAVTDCGR